MTDQVVGTVINNPYVLIIIVLVVVAANTISIARMKDVLSSIQIMDHDHKELKNQVDTLEEEMTIVKAFTDKHSLLCDNNTLRIERTIHSAINEVRKDLDGMTTGLEQIRIILGRRYESGIPDNTNNE